MSDPAQTKRTRFQVGPGSCLNCPADLAGILLPAGLANIRRNIILSLAVVAFLVAAALAGALSLTTALLLNEGIALLIIPKGLRLPTPIRQRVKEVVP